MKAVILAAGFGTRLEEGFRDYSGEHRDALHSFVYDSDTERIRQKGLITINVKQ